MRLVLWAFPTCQQAAPLSWCSVEPAELPKHPASLSHLTASGRALAMQAGSTLASPFLWGPSWFKKEEKKKKHPKTKIPSVTVSLHFGKSKAHLPGTWGLELTFPISFAIQRLSWPRGGLNRSPSGGNVDRGNYLSLDEGFHSAGGQPWGASLQPQRGAHALPEVDRDIPTFLP